MFTVKVYWSNWKQEAGKSHTCDRLDLYEGENVSVEDTGISIFHNAEMETTWVPKPELPGETEHRTGERPDMFVDHVIVENAAGNTTEFIRA